LEIHQNISSPAIRTLQAELLFVLPLFQLQKKAISQKNKSAVPFLLHFLLTVFCIKSIAVTHYSIPSAVRSTEQSS
jgi:hypothetical protein